MAEEGEVEDFGLEYYPDSDDEDDLDYLKEEQ